MRLSWGIVMLLVLAGVGWAQEPARRPADEQTVKIETALVSVPVIVSDRQGRYISGLKQADFTLYEDKVKQQIAFFADTEEPINVAVLLDTSRSTAEVLGDIRHAAKDFLKHLRAQDRAMIGTFDFEVKALCGLTGDRKTLERAVDEARIGERIGTKLRDAVGDVLNGQFKGVRGRKAIILLTDGKDHGSRLGEEALMELASEADTQIYTVFFMTLPPQLARSRPQPMPRMGRRGGIFTPYPRFPAPPRPNPGREENRRRRAERIEARNGVAIEFLEELSDVSAGRSFRSETTRLKQTFEQIVEELRHQYRLGFYPPEDRAPGSTHQLRVEVARADVAVRARHSYRK